MLFRSHLPCRIDSNDRINRVHKTAKQAEDLLAAGNSREAYQVLQKWYRDNAEQTTNPTYDDIDEIQKEYKKLYAKKVNENDEIKTYVKFNIDDNIPEEAEIIKAMNQMKNGKSPGPSGISIDDIKTWYRKARLSDDVNVVATKKWENVIEIIQIAFREGKVPATFKKGILKLIPKPGGKGFRGIALLESMYKLISMIIHKRMMSSVEFHESIHGFRTNRGTSTAIINIKLRMQLAKREKNPLYMVFLDVKKAYDTIDRQRTINMLGKYGLGERTCKLIKNMWEEDIIIPKQQMFYGKSFNAERGVKQGDIMSPTIFNIIIDSIVRDCIQKMKDKGDETTNIQFYADDGIIAGDNYEQVQYILNIIKENFLSFGLEMNIEKTETMIMSAKKKQYNMSTTAYERRITGIGTTNNESQKINIQCEWCDKSVQTRSMKNHQLSARCISIRKIKEKSTNYMRNMQQCIEINNTTESKVYQIDMPTKTICKCPCEGCSFDTNNRTRMQKHFRSRHAQDIIIIAQEGLLPQCMECGLFQKNVNEANHLDSEECKRFTEIKRNRRLDMCNEASKNVCFEINGENVKTVNSFKYLGRILNDNDNDLSAVEAQLTKARMTWGRIGKVIKKRSGSNIKIMSIFYKVIVQSVLLYGSESWVLNEKAKNKLKSFHNRCARFITGRHIRKIDETWICPDTKTTLELADLLTTNEYIEQRKETIREFAIGTDIFQKYNELACVTKTDNSLELWKEIKKSVLGETEISEKNGSNLVVVEIQKLN